MTTTVQTTAPGAINISTTAPAATPENTTPVTTPTTIAPVPGSPVTPSATTPIMTADPFAALTQENRDLITKKGWKSHDDIVKSYAELERLNSTKAAAQVAPASPADYKLDAPTDLPKEAGYNDAFAGWFRDAAHKAGISQEGAKGLHDAFVGFAKENFGKSLTAQTESLQQVVTKAATDLKAVWGPEGTPQFTRSLEMAKRAMSQLGIADDLKSMGAITADGNIANARVMNALAQVGTKLYSEDTIFGQASNGINPFDPKTANLTQQGAMIKSDPEKAKMLIRAAGPDTVRMYGHFLARR